MGNAQGTVADGSEGEKGEENVSVQSPKALFRELDGEKRGYLTLKELLVEKTSAPSHSLPALFFCDLEKNGRINEDEFLMLVKFCYQERKKVKGTLLKDKGFRELIQRASAAGVKDSSAPCRISFRRLSSFKDVRSIYTRPSRAERRTKEAASARPPRHVGPKSQGLHPPRVPSKIPRNRSMPVGMDNVDSEMKTSSAGSRAHTTDELAVDRLVVPGDLRSLERIDEVRGHPSGSRVNGKSFSNNSDGERGFCVPKLENGGRCSSEDYSQNSLSRYNHTEEEESTDSETGYCRTVSMYGSQLEYFPKGKVNVLGPAAEKVSLRCEDLEPSSITALDAAVVENVMRTHICKLADLLHSEKTRVQFMQWLWELADFNDKSSVGLMELRVFFAALSEDGIDLEELAFYKEPAVSLEERILNEFDTKHRGHLTRTEFLSLADLITREYEFWECRHLERIGNYELGRTIGRGSSGVVRSALNTETREKFAMKIIKKGTLSDLNRLDTEIQSLMLTKHPNIVSLIEVMESDDNTFLVLELCGGGSLIDMVRIYPGEKMPEDTARYYVRQLFEALAYCHSCGICHRDVRAENMLLDNYGTLKLSDFGHAGIYSSGWDYFSSNLVGSIFNLSPEQLIGQPYSGEKIDVWSAGVAMYCLLVGRPPFCDADTNRLVESILSGSFSIPETVSRDAADLMRCAVQVSPAARPSMNELLHHPWFFSGPEVAPIMNVVNIFVDSFFIRRPDLAQMVIAKMIHDYNIHFHLGDIEDPNSSATELRGQNWALKCCYPKKDIKFFVSFYTHEPTAQGGGSNMFHSKTVGDRERDQTEVDIGACASVGEPLETAAKALGGGQCMSASSGSQLPMSDGPVYEEGAADSVTLGAPRSTSMNEFKLTRSRSLDEELEGMLNVTRSAAADTFPCQRTLPQRQKPSTAPSFISRKSVDDTSLYMSRRSRTKKTWSTRRDKANRAGSPDHASEGDDHHHSKASKDAVGEEHLRAADKNIKRRLSVHPSKASMFLTSNMHGKLRFGMDSSHGLSTDELNSGSMSASTTELGSGWIKYPELGSTNRLQRTNRVTLGSPRGSRSESWSCFDVNEGNSKESDFRPFLQVRLKDGESGLFLKICRKLKTVCETKLAATAERYRKRGSGCASPLMRRVRSVRLLTNDCTKL